VLHRNLRRRRGGRTASLSSGSRAARREAHRSTPCLPVSERGTVTRGRVQSFRGLMEVKQRAAVHSDNRCYRKSRESHTLFLILVVLSYL